MGTGSVASLVVIPVRPWTSAGLAFTMQVHLVDRNLELVHHWRAAFADAPDVQCHHGSVFDHPADAIISPANSFGVMDGGIDLVYSQTFGWELEEAVGKIIQEEHFGELPVGSAVVAPIVEHPDFRWLISAPTMRVPMRVEETAQPMLAFRAALATARTHGFASVTCPGLGTGEGRMPPSRCARQMRYAWKVVVEGHRERLGGLAGAVRNHLYLLEREV